MDVALTAQSEVLPSRRAPLAAELSACGIPTLDTNVVKHHMQNTIETHRTGIYKILGPAVYMVSMAFYLITQATYFWLSALLVLASIVVATILSFAGVPNAGLIALVSALVFFGFFIALFVFSERTHVHSHNYNVNLAKAATIWMKDPILEFSRSDLLAYSIPERLHTRVMRLSRIPNVRVHKLRFDLDPILEVSRTHFFLFKERAYIGGWDTGVPAIDNV